MDMENTFASVRHSQLLYELVYGATRGNELRMDVERLTERALGGAHLGDSPDYELVAIPGITVTKIKDLYVKCGWRMEIIYTSRVLGERVKRVIASFVRKAERQDWRLPAPTIVLFTGNGEVLRGGLIRDAVRRGVVNLEVHAWLHSMSNGYLDLLESYPRRVRICPFDEDADNLLVTVAGLQRKPEDNSIAILLVVTIVISLPLSWYSRVS